MAFSVSDDTLLRKTSCILTAAIEKAVSRCYKPNAVDSKIIGK